MRSSMRGHRIRRSSPSVDLYPAGKRTGPAKIGSLATRRRPALEVEEIDEEADQAAEGERHDGGEGADHDAEQRDRDDLVGGREVAAACFRESGPAVLMRMAFDADAGHSEHLVVSMADSTTG